MFLHFSPFYAVHRTRISDITAGSDSKTVVSVSFSTHDAVQRGLEQALHNNDKLTAHRLLSVVIITTWTMIVHLCVVLFGCLRKYD